MRLIVAGGRDFTDYGVVSKILDRILKKHPVDFIVSGKEPNGTDALGERYAGVNGIPVLPYPADWLGGLKKAAGPIRNEEMAKNADGAIIFWDGKSPGSKNMIKNALKYNLPFMVFSYKGELLQTNRPDIANEEPLEPVQQGLDLRS